MSGAVRNTNDAHRKGTHTPHYAITVISSDRVGREQVNRRCNKINPAAFHARSKRTSIDSNLIPPRGRHKNTTTPTVLESGDLRIIISATDRLLKHTRGSQIITRQDREGELPLPRIFDGQYEFGDKVQW